MALKISVSGIRGIVGEDLIPSTIVSYVAAFLNVLDRKTGTVLVGRDARESGRLIVALVESTAAALGWDCIQIGIAPTPTILLATRKLGCDGGIAVTASHNPAQWNALKFCDTQGLFLRKNQIDRIEHMVAGKVSFDWKGFQELGKTSLHEDAVSLHIEQVLQHLDCDKIRRGGFRVVVDPCGSTGAVVDRRFLEALGCSVYGINESISGIFPREPEPVPGNLSLLSNAVRERGAHLGFAQDPDADRLAVVADDGVPIGEEYTLVLAGESFLRRNRTDIAVNQSTSMMVDDLARRYGVRVHRTKIGEINVTESLLNNGLEFGGEGNGGVIVPRVNPCRDSLTAMGLILELLSQEKGRCVSDILKDFTSYCMIKDKIEHDFGDMQQFYAAIGTGAKASFEQHRFSTMDGIKIYNNEEWLHIRASNTEPAVRIIAESLSRTRAEQLITMGKKLVASSKNE
jgi:phosphomannomutase